MKTTIYYFTGTGNSLKVAKDLANHLEGCELIPIAKVWDIENLESNHEKVGFIFPLYWSGLPKIVDDFINKIDLSKSKYFFCVITSAGDINEQPIQQIEGILRKKSKILNAGFYITMPNNYILGFGITPEAKQKLLFESAIKQISDIAKRIKSREDNLSQDVLNKDVSRSKRMNKSFRERVFESDKSFYSDEKCTSCGICKDVCPVNNIELDEGRPRWQHRCQQCLACINFCPEEAIQFNTKSVNMGRYHHPEITLKEIINQKK
jgi:ferredoxin/flavodoxin